MKTGKMSINREKIRKIIREELEKELNEKKSKKKRRKSNSGITYHNPYRYNLFIPQYMYNFSDVGVSSADSSGAGESGDSGGGGGGGE